MSNWDESTNTERGQQVRQHATMGKVCPGCNRPLVGKALTYEGLMELFHLTRDELSAVLAGADYPDRQDA